MRVVTKPRVSESEKPAEKPKEEGEEVNTCAGWSMIWWKGCTAHLHALV